MVGTIGIWEISPVKNSENEIEWFDIIIDKEDEIIRVAEVNAFRIDKKEAHENALMIVQARSLLEICKELLAEYEGAGYCASQELIERAHQIIKKAEGAK